MFDNILAILILLDRIVNVLLGGAWRETLSSRAHRMRAKGQPVWGWTADFIDWWAYALFRQKDHCRRQWALEVSMGWHA